MKSSSLPQKKTKAFVLLFPVRRFRKSLSIWSSISSRKAFPWKRKTTWTADAVLQAMVKHQALEQGSFVVLNGDNIYSRAALEALYSLPQKQQALIGYARDGLRFTKERIQKFAVLDYNTQHQLTQLIEKPSAAAVERVQNIHEQLRVSMNILNYMALASGFI